MGLGVGAEEGEGDGEGGREGLRTWTVADADAGRLACGEVADASSVMLSLPMLFGSAMRADSPAPSPGTIPLTE